MKHLNKLNESNRLLPEQKLWFQVPKNLEEFYDLKNDPFELNNLINQTDYLNQIVDMRGQLDDWMEKINDLGYLTEEELVKVVAK
jgi:predicted component of type VI protein secretion system